MNRFVLSYIFLLLVEIAFAQHKSTITESYKELLTYPYGDPNPIPILTGKGFKIYPYHSFDGFTSVPQKHKWKVVTLENDYIQVFVCPEIGGKVWGAIEKSTGKEFIYSNDVVKFRNIAMRGPWTSGGIEFNLGLIGHTPATAGPVDYCTRENADGSVSCIVGNIDLPSRTQWRVEIRLPKDKAYFETIPLWYNPTPIPQSYYCFMTGSAAVSDDLEFFYPGNQALEHSGEVKSWPEQEGHIKSMYANNAYDSHTSVHVVGDYNDFMGGYYHKSNFGFGHWALYSDMPGRKLWLWALSPEGGIWKDLLTDSHGQYMEFQAGRTFNQYVQGSYRSPIKEMPFNPSVTDQWREIWFPVKDIGGLLEVSPKGLLNVKHENGKLNIGINSLVFSESQIIVRSNDKVIFTQAHNFSPMDVFKTSVGLEEDLPYEVSVEGLDLSYSSSKKNLIKRPFATTLPMDSTSAYSMFQEGMQFKENRNYEKAKICLKNCLKRDPLFIDAMAYMAELYYRSNQLDSAINYINKALQLDAYHPAANYFAGITYRAKGDLINALETMGWAARSMEFRSVANSQLAGIELQLNNFDLAEHYAIQSLDFNRLNVEALKILSVIHRLRGETTLADQTLASISALDPLNHFVDLERYQLHNSPGNLNLFKANIRNEFPYQTYLELAIDYFNLGRKAEATQLLEISPDHPLVAIWKAYLKDDVSSLNEIIKSSPAFVFPYRTETVSALEWAVSNNNNWTFKYFLGLNYWAIQRVGDARDMFISCKHEPDYATFYLSRAFLLDQLNESESLKDLQMAYKLAPDEWRTAYRLIEEYIQIADYKSALQLSSPVALKFKDNFNLALQNARVLLGNNQFEACLKSLEKIQILPFEGSTQGKNVFEQANIELAIDLIEKKKYKEAIVKLERSKEWPENLGVGKPFDPDNRMQDYLLALCYEKLGRQQDAKSLQDEILSYTAVHYVGGNREYNNLFALLIFHQRGSNDQANLLLEKIKVNNSPIQQWIVAFFTNDTQKCQTLENVVSKSAYYSILKQILVL